MRRRCRTLVLLVLMAGGSVWAQSPPRLMWQHDGVGVSYFACVIDANPSVTLGLPTPVGTTYTVFLSACGTMAAGTHTLVVQACDDPETPEDPLDDTCTNSLPLVVVKV